MKTIEQVGKWLLSRKIPFSYNADGIRVHSQTFDLFESATYHFDSKRLVLMDREYDEVNIDDLINL